MTARTLISRGIEFYTVNLEDDPAQADEFRAAGLMQAPIVVTDNATWSGFRPDLIAGLHN